MRRIYILFGLLFFISCKKENDDEIAYKKFNTIQYACGSLTVFKANYDGDKLISLIGQGGTLRNYYFIYNSQGQLTQRDIETSTGRQKLTEYTYNGAGQLIEKKDLLPVCPSGTEYYKYIFTYDKGKLVESTGYLKNNTLADYIFSARRVYAWTGENITSVQTYDINNVPYPEPLNFTYDLTQPNPLSVFKDFWLQDLYDSPGTVFFFHSKNLLTKLVWPTFDCPVNYDFYNSYNPRLPDFIRPTCLGTLWVFTYGP